MASLDFVSTISIPAWLWILSLLFAIALEVAQWYPGSGATPIILVASGLALFSAVDVSRVGFVAAACTSLYICWLVAFSLALTSGANGLDSPGIPVSERKLWYSPIAGNAPVAIAVIISMIAGSQLLGYLVRGSAAETSVLAHNKRQRLLDIAGSGRRERDQLLRVVHDQVPPYARHCMQQGIDAF